MEAKNFGKEWTSCNTGLSRTLLVSDHFLDLLHGCKVDRPKAMIYERTRMLNKYWFYSLFLRFQVGCDGVRWMNGFIFLSVHVINAPLRARCTVGRTSHLFLRTSG